MKYVIKMFRKMSWRKWKKLEGADSRLSLIKVGDLLHDCDGFNHFVGEVEVARRNIGNGRWYVYNINVYHADGNKNMFCQCPGFPRWGKSVEEIEKYHMRWDNPEALEVDKAWGFGIAAVINKIKRGEAICDLDGVPHSDE